MWRSSEPQSPDVKREYQRIGLGAGERLPLPKGLKSESDYLAFLKQVPDASGVRGFMATMAARSRTT